MFPSPEPFRNFTRRFQPHRIQHGFLLTIRNTENILLDQITGQIKIIRADGIGCNRYPVLAFLAAGQRHFRLKAQFLLLYFCNILADEQDLARPARIPFQTDNVHMFPFSFLISVNQIFITYIGGSSSQPGNNLSGLKEHGIFIPLLFLRQKPAQIFRQILITSTLGKIIPFRLRSGKILICTRFQIHHHKPGKHGINSFHHITHFPVFLFQYLFLPARLKQQGNNIYHKHSQQQQLQFDAQIICLADHPLCNMLRKCLYQNICIIHKGNGAYIIRRIYFITLKCAFSAVFKYFRNTFRSIRIYDIISPQEGNHLLFGAGAGILLISGMSDNSPVTHTQKSIRLFSKIHG